MVLVDSHSKWLEIEQHEGSNELQHYRQLYVSGFQQFGLHETTSTVIMDNNLYRNILQLHLENNEITQIRSSVYHPCSNGGAERFIQTIKKGHKACNIETKHTWSTIK